MRLRLLLLFFPFFLHPVFSQVRKNLVLAPVQCPMHYGLINSKGDTLFPARFDEVLPFTAEVQETTPAKQNGVWGYINHKGDWIYPPRFGGAFPYCAGYAVVMVGDSLQRNISYTRNYLDGAEFRFGLVNNKGEWKIKPTWNKLIWNGKTLWFKNTEGLWGLMTADEKQLIPPSYSAVYPSGSGLTVVVKGVNGIFDRYGDPELITGGKWGLVNQEGKEILAPCYTYISPSQEGMSAFNDRGSWSTERYYSQEKKLHGGKWGFLDSTGKVTVPAQFESVKDFHEGVAYVVPKDSGYYIDRQGNKKTGPPVQQVNLKEVTKEEPCTVFCSSAQWAFVDTAGHEVIPPAYGDARAFCNGFAAVRNSYPCWVQEGGSPPEKAKYKIFDRIRDMERGENVDKSLTLFHPADTITERWGFINPEGKLIIPFQFEKVADFSEGMAAVCLNGQWGFVNTKGEIVIVPKFDDDFEHTLGFKGGLALIHQNGLIGFIDKSGKQVVPAVYSKARDFSEGLAPVKVGERWGYINTAGKIVIHPAFQEVGDFSGGIALAKKNEEGTVDENGGHYGFIDTKGNWIIPPKFGKCRGFKDGLAAVMEDKADPENSGKYDYYRRLWGYVDRNGTLIIPYKYTSTCDFESGIAFVRTREDGMYIDRSGNVLIAHVNMDYGDEAPHRKYQEGYAVQMAPGGLFGFKDKKRNWAVKPVYQQVSHFTKVYGSPKATPKDGKQ
ncbi:MAG: WG repeat-containing protein [Bacteroidia bacterium]